MPPPLQPQAQPAAPSLAQLEGPTAPNGAVAVVVDGKSCDLLDALMAEGAQSFSLGGSRTGPAQRYTTEDLRAATELSNQIETLKAPAPPQLQPAHTETQRLHLLKAAFRAVHEKVMGTDYWRPRKELTAKEHQALMAACEALMVEGINPTAWARFSFHQWGRMGQKSAPTPKWVWTASRISEHAGWCHDATGSLNTGAVVPVPASRELMLRLSVLRQQLGWGRPTDVVVSEVLPKDERRALLIKQANQLEAGRRELEQQINNGEWVWG